MPRIVGTIVSIIVIIVVLAMIGYATADPTNFSEATGAGILSCAGFLQGVWTSVFE